MDQSGKVHKSSISISSFVLNSLGEHLQMCKATLQVQDHKLNKAQPCISLWCCSRTFDVSFYFVDYFLLFFTLFLVF